MIKIWLLLMLMSTPNQSAIRYNAVIYPTENHCMTALGAFMEAYEEKPPEYKLGFKTEAFCIPFNSFPIIGMPAPVGA